MDDELTQIEREIKAILKNTKTEIRYKLDFPRYKILPDEVRLALSVLESHGMKIIVTFEKKPDPLP